MSLKATLCLGSLVLLLLAALAAPPDARADASTPTVNRVFYLTGGGTNKPGSLSLSRPSGNTTIYANLNSSIEFTTPLPLQSPPQVFMNTPMNVSLLVQCNRNASVTVRADLAERVLGSYFTIQNFTEIQPVVTGIHQFNFTAAFQSQGLLPYSQLSVTLRATAFPKANVTLRYSSSTSPSFVALPLSDYESVSGVAILDHQGRAAQSFDLSAVFPNDTIIFQASIVSAFGFSDISRINLTLVDPLSRPVFRSEMRFTGQSNEIQPFVHTAFWYFPPNATEGTYQVHVDVIDQQNQVASRYTGATSAFGLTRTSPLIRATLNLLPYFAAGVGGIGLLGGVVYYSRRKSKSFLVPFDYFNTLTGGELDGGSVVTVEGNTGSGKSLLSEEMMYEDLKKGKPCVFVATGDFPSNVRENMKSMGLDPTGYEQTGLLKFVDGYSSEAGQESREKLAIPSLGDLTTMNMKIASTLQPDSFKGGSLYFDSLTPLASKTKPDSLVSFVQSVGAKVRGLGGKAFFTVGPSIDGSIQRKLEDMADCVVQMEAYEERGTRKSRLKIIKLRSRRFQQGWVTYTIEAGKGIIFYSKKPRQ